jgi:hypothetical protein
MLPFPYSLMRNMHVLAHHQARQTLPVAVSFWRFTIGLGCLTLLDLTEMKKLRTQVKEKDAEISRLKGRLNQCSWKGEGEGQGKSQAREREESRAREGRASGLLRGRQH